MRWLSAYNPTPLPIDASIICTTIQYQILPGRIAGRAAAPGNSP